jgi:hypothetical protein
MLITSQELASVDLQTTFTTIATTAAAFVTAVGRLMTSISIVVSDMV